MCIVCLSSIFAQNSFFYFSPGHAVSASWRLSGGCWRRAPCSLSWRAFSRENNQVAWKTEHRWGQRELSAHLPCHWWPSWTRPVDGGCGDPGWCWGAGRMGDGPAGSRRSCITLRHQFSLYVRKLHFGYEKVSWEKTDRESKKRSRKGCVSCHTVDIVLILSTCPLTSVDLCGLLNLSLIVFNPSIQNKEEYMFVPCSTYIRRS